MGGVECSDLEVRDRRCQAVGTLLLSLLSELCEDSPPNNSGDFEIKSRRRRRL